jgi:hypothetical protein
VKSRALRWTAFALFVAVLMTAAYLLWKSETASLASTTFADNFTTRTATLARTVLELRMGQQAYVAAGQGDEFWGSKVAARVATLREELAALRALASTADAQAQLDDALASLGDFERMDARVREYCRGNQRLLASDLIFSDGLEKTEAITAALDAAGAAELRQADDSVSASRRRQLLIAGGASAAALLLGAVLVPAPRTAALHTPPRQEVPAATTEAPSETAIEPLPLRDVRDPVPPQPIATPTSLREEAERETTDPLDLGRVAALCTELARVVDNRALPSVMERTAAVLDANGVVLWIADPDGRELNPILTHGYSPQLVTRLGTIPRDAQNATAAAFRTSLLQTVDGDEISNGAIAVPLVTPAGCVGVMAAEVRHGGEKQDAKLAAAAIVAAQLATLVGPPSARPHARSEAAGA